MARFELRLVTFFLWQLMGEWVAWVVLLRFVLVDIINFLANAIDLRLTYVKIPKI